MIFGACGGVTASGRRTLVVYKSQTLYFTQFCRTLQFVTFDFTEHIVRTHLWESPSDLR